MPFFKRLKSDFLARRNLDGYVTVAVALTVTVFDIFGIIEIPVISSAILAVLALVSFSLLQTRQENQDLTDLLSASSTVASGKFPTSVYFAPRNTECDTKIYDMMIKTMTSAQQSIRVISIYKPASMKVTPERLKYYDALEKFLDEKRKNNQKFTFERIVQVMDAQQETLAKEETDSLAFKHSQFLETLRASSVTVRQTQIKDGVRPIGFAIIDQKKVMFLLPSVAIDENGRLRSYQQVGAEIIMTDTDGELVARMTEIFDDLRYDSKPLKVLQGGT
jgi:hypothetical protein